MKLRKIYYVPGLISAILIPLLFWFYGNRKLQEPLPNVMNFGIPQRYNPKDTSFQLGTFMQRNWNYKKILVQPNTARKNSKYYVSELKKLQARNKKNTGVEFIIGNKNSYDDFISILNDFEKAQQEHYTLDLDKTNHFFAMVDYKDPNKIEEPCYLCNDTVAVFYEPTLFEKITYQYTEFRSLPKNAFYIIFGYLILLNISVLSLVRKSI